MIVSVPSNGQVLDPTKRQPKNSLFVLDSFVKFDSARLNMGLEEQVYPRKSQQILGRDSLWARTDVWNLKFSNRGLVRPYGMSALVLPDSSGIADKGDFRPPKVLPRHFVRVDTVAQMLSSTIDSVRDEVSKQLAEISKAKKDVISRGIDILDADRPFLDKEFTPQINYF